MAFAALRNAEGVTEFLFKVTVIPLPPVSQHLWEYAGA